jgi:hypothetical protein
MLHLYYELVMSCSFEDFIKMYPQCLIPCAVSSLLYLAQKECDASVTFWPLLLRTDHLDNWVRVSERSRIIIVVVINSNSRS